VGIEPRNTHLEEPRCTHYGSNTQSRLRRLEGGFRQRSDRPGAVGRASLSDPPTDDPNYVTIDLEFDSASEAEAVHTALRELWRRVEVMHSPQARIVEIVESKEY
jgi:hypothetical protein